MIRVVLDTNVIVSALLTAHGAEAAVLLLTLYGTISLVFSDPVLAEYREVLSRPKFKRPADVVTGVLADIRSVGHHVRPKRMLTVCAHDPDNRFLECAEAAEAHFLITGNKRHFPAVWKATRVANARQFLEYFAALQSE